MNDDMDLAFQDLREVIEEREQSGEKLNMADTWEFLLSMSLRRLESEGLSQDDDRAQLP